MTKILPNLKSQCDFELMNPIPSIFRINVETFVGFLVIAFGRGEETTVIFIIM